MLRARPYEATLTAVRPRRGGGGRAQQPDPAGDHGIAHRCRRGLGRAAAGQAPAHRPHPGVAPARLLAGGGRRRRGGRGMVARRSGRGHPDRLRLPMLASPHLPGRPARGRAGRPDRHRRRRHDPGGGHDLRPGAEHDRCGGGRPHRGQRLRTRDARRRHRVTPGPAGGAVRLPGVRAGRGAGVRVRQGQGHPAGGGGWLRPDQPQPRPSL